MIKEQEEFIKSVKRKTPEFKIENGQLYVRYSATEEWRSLGIVQGADGKDGSDGKDGEDGRDGADGQDGVNGKDGADGKDGVDGQDGVNGKDGINGKDGADGKDGLVIASTAIGSTALAINIILIAYALIKKKKLF